MPNEFTSILKMLTKTSSYVISFSASGGLLKANRKILQQKKTIQNFEKHGRACKSTDPIL
jgi:hypothetical protein